MKAKKVTEKPKHEMNFDMKQFVENVTSYLKECLEESGRDKFVIGLSGGIDSAVSLALAVKAVGKDKVIPVAIPNGDIGFMNRSDSFKVACQFLLKDKFQMTNISPMVKVFERELKTKGNVRCGNIAARCRMIVLYDIAAAEKGIVLGTENRTEHELGYFTIGGDEVSDFEPIRALWKTQVRMLAEYLGVPQEIIDKPPTAGLWDGQTDEDELGITYEEADIILEGILDLGLSDKEIINNGATKEGIKIVRERMSKVAHKTQPVFYPKITY